MSTSFRSRVVDAVPLIEEKAHDFVYRAVNGSKELVNSETDRLGLCSSDILWKIFAAPGQNKEPPRKYTEDDLRTREKQSWEAGFQEGESRARTDLTQAVTAERAKVGAALDNFQRERELYYQNTEGEIVQLALAIAPKILHREAQVDPLLLTGVARVALEKIATGSTVRLRVPSQELGKWQETLAAAENLQPQPELVGDATLSGAQLILETEVGTADLSLEAQLKEIELRGFWICWLCVPKNSDE